MENTRQRANNSSPPRHYREESADSQDEPVEVGLTAEPQLLIFTTDEPGGDPYNHTGRFKRIYR